MNNYTLMEANGVKTETLHPENKVAKLYINNTIV